MKRVLLIAALALTACGPTSSPAPNAAAPVAETSAAPTPAASLLTSETLIGRWGDNGDCMKDIVFANDGTFRSYTGGVGQWSLSGNILTMSGEGGVFQLQVRPIDARTLELTNPDGSVATSQRC